MSDQPPSANRLEAYMPIDAELLPCPFCGGEATLTNVRQSNHTFIVGCYNEQCVRPRTDGYGAKEDVVGLWNHRPSQPPSTMTTEEQLMFAELSIGDAFTFDHDVEGVVYRKTGQREYALVTPLIKKVGSRTAPVTRFHAASAPQGQSMRPDIDALAASVGSVGTDRRPTCKSLRDCSGPNCDCGQPAPQGQENEPMRAPTTRESSETLTHAATTDARPVCANTKTCREPCEDEDGCSYCTRCGLWEGAR
jgi:hypothetical protein